MKDLTIEEANRIVAEFMGEEDNYCSLDKLVMVWEKMEIFSFTMANHKTVGYHVASLKSETVHIAAKGKSGQEAALLATAKAVRERI